MVKMGRASYEERKMIYVYRYIYIYVLRKTWDRSAGGGEFRKFNRWTLARMKDDSFRRFVNRVTLQVLACRL